jgi:hypothetical protein
VSRPHFRRVVQDTLVDAPNITLPDAIRHFIRNEGGPATIREFLRKFPWAAKVFNTEKVAHAENVRKMDALPATHRLPTRTICNTHHKGR